MLKEIRLMLALNSKDKDRIEKLLALEKERRGVSQEDLVFIGTANLANYYWCAMQSLYKHKDQELEFFFSYLSDRILYNFELNKIKGKDFLEEFNQYLDNLPKTDSDILEIGDKITLDNIEYLLKERENRILEGNGLSIGERGIERNEIKNGKIKVPTNYGYIFVDYTNDESSPLEKGRNLQITHSKNYPTIRWNFGWGNFVIIGVPDGIVEDKVYEFKTTKNEYLFHLQKGIALVQADLYGYFFNRKNKEVEFYIISEEQFKRWDEEVNKGNAEDILNKFKELYESGEPIPPKRWKCKKCEYRGECQIFGK